MAYGFEKTLGLTNSHSVFLARLNAAAFPSAAIDGGANSIANGGGNLVVYADNTRTVRLPIYVSKFVTGGTPNIAVYVRVPNASPTTVLYIEANESQATQPAVDAAYGAHECFIDYYLYASLDSLNPVDLSGNHTLTATGVTTLRSAPFGGECIEFNGSNYIEVDGGVTPIASHLYTLGCEVENDELPAQQRLIAGVNNNPNGHLLVAAASAWPTSTPNTYTFNADVSGGSTYINASADIITAGAKHVINCAHIWTSRDLYVNGSLEGSVTASITHDATTGPFRIGKDHQSGSAGFVGGIANVRVHKSKISTEYDSDEYANLSAVDSWGAVGAWENNTTNVSPVDIAISNDTITLSAGANAVVGALTVTDPDAGDTHTITTTSADFSVSGINLICLDPSALGAGSFDVEITADDGVSAPYVETITINIVYDVTLLSVISHAGSGTIAPNSGLSLIVDDSTDVTGVTVGGVAATGMVKDAGGTLIDVVTPLNVNAKIGDSVDIVLVISSGVTNTVSATVVDPAGFQSVTSTTDYAGLPADSFMYSNAEFSALAVGDQLVIEQQTADLYNVVATTDMVVSLEAGTPEGSYDVDYYLIDNAGVASTAIGTITVVVGSASADVTAPVITLLGANPLTLAQGSAYVEPGFTAVDDTDGDITADVVVTGSVDENTLGSYVLSYNVADAAGNAAVQVQRTVNVVDQASPSVLIGPVVGTQVGDFAIAITADEIVTLDTPVINLSDGAAGVITGSGTDWQATITPPVDNNGSITVQIAAATFVDGSGNQSTISNEITVTYDTRVNSPATGSPLITGTIAEDQTLSVDTSLIADGDGLGAFNYQWLRDGVAVPGATDSTYLLGSSDVGSAISVQVSFTDAQGFSEVTVSDSTVAVPAVNHPATGLPVITGNAISGRALSVDVSGIADVDGVGSFFYQWLKDGVDVVGATLATYMIASTDTGSTLSVRVSFVDGDGNVETLISAATATVTANTPPVADGGDVTIYDDASIGSSVATIQASDADGDALVFSIVYGNERGDFAINSSTGEITVAKTLNSNIRSSYELKTLVSDGTDKVIVDILIIVAKKAISESVEADIAFYPAANDGLPQGLYDSNTNMLVVSNIAGSLTGGILLSPSITVTLKKDGTAMSGASWPLSLSVFEKGKYYVVIPAGVSLAVGDEIDAEIDLVEGSVVASWAVDLVVYERDN